MAEFSIFWTTGTSGDGTSTYTETQLTDWLRRVFNGGPNQGVLKGFLNGLAVSGVASPVDVATGGASVYGFPYENTAVVTVAIPTPSVSTRVDRIVLRASWAAHTVRITRIAGTEGAGAPAITQTPATTYDIPLAQVSINTGGVITVIDERQWLRPNVMPPSDFEGGWIDCTNDDWTYVSATSFTVPTDLTAKYRKAAKLRWKEGGSYKYGYVVSSSYGAPNTTVNLYAGSDFSLAGGAITDNYISYIEEPEGFPHWFNWDPAPTGYSAVPAGATYKFRIDGQMVSAYLCEPNNGTSNLTTKDFTAPVSAKATSGLNWAVKNPLCVNNNVSVETGVLEIFGASPTVISAKTTGGGGGWTASGNCRVAGLGVVLQYQMD